MLSTWMPSHFEKLSFSSMMARTSAGLGLPVGSGPEPGDVGGSDAVSSMGRILGVDPGLSAGQQGMHVRLGAGEGTRALDLQRGHGRGKFSGGLDRRLSDPLEEITGHIGVAAAGGVDDGSRRGIGRDIVESIFVIDNGTHAPERDHHFLYAPGG